MSAFIVLHYLYQKNYTLRYHLLSITMGKAKQTVTVIVDSRERQGMDFSFFYTNVSAAARTAHGSRVIVDKQMLEFGDFIIRTDEREVVVERKTFNDMAGSIRSGHRDEQRVALDSYRRSKEIPVHVVWVLEGNLDGAWHEGTQLRDGMKNQALDQAMDSLCFKDGFSTHWTGSPAHTAQYVGVTLPRRMLKSDGFKQSFAADGAAQESLVNVVATNKKSMLRADKGMVYRCMLSCVPGLTAGVASAIQVEFPTMRDLVSAFESAVKPEKVLCDIQPEGRSKKVGPKLSRRVYDALFNVEEDIQDVQAKEVDGEDDREKIEAEEEEDPDDDDGWLMKRKHKSLL